MVGSAVPFTSTTLVEVNPEPLTVRVSAVKPAVMLAGLIDVMAGVGVVPPPPDPEPDAPPPHPLVTTSMPISKEKITRRNEGLRPKPAFTDLPTFRAACNS